MAYRLHLAYLIHLKETGRESEIENVEMSEHAEAGAQLEAELADDIHTLRVIYQKMHTQ